VSSDASFAFSFASKRLSANVMHVRPRPRGARLDSVELERVAGMLVARIEMTAGNSSNPSSAACHGIVAPGGESRQFRHSSGARPLRTEWITYAGTVAINSGCVSLNRRRHHIRASVSTSAWRSPVQWW